MFLEISQHSQENACARVSFLIKLQALACNFIQKETWHRRFPVNVGKFLSTPFFTVRSKTRKPRKFFSEIFKTEFLILAVRQNRKLRNKKTRNNISKICEISKVSEFSICHFYHFSKNFLKTFRTLYLCYVLFSKPFKVFFPSPKICIQNISMS